MNNLKLPKDKSNLSKDLADLVSVKEYIDLAEEQTRNIDEILISMYEMIRTNLEVLQEAQLQLNNMIMDKCF